jgi:NAD(P)-dependent dehydrogenase (short-subunit alcohol dehydrogenase family)
MGVIDLFNLSGTVALVTGGSRGLGLDSAIALGEAGADIVVTARREQWLSSAAATLKEKGIEAVAMACDVTAPEQVDAVIAAVLDRFGRLDILVNNAGVSWGQPAETVPVDKWRGVLDTNVTGSFLVARAAAAAMMRAERGGAIVNIASIAGLVGTSADVLDAVGYSASKGAIISMTRDLAVKWATHGIRVNAIAPGFFETRMTTGVLERSRPSIEQLAPMGRIGRPGELQGAVLFLASPASAYVTGHVLVVDGGTTAW